jgi:hypothetical protein
MGGVVVSKCANPGCAATFRYFHQGKLFHLETEAGLERRRALGNDDEKKKPLRRIEFYWLYENCAQKMTIVFEKGAGMAARPNALPKAAGF